MVQLINFKPLELIRFYKKIQEYFKPKIDNNNNENIDPQMNHDDGENIDPQMNHKKQSKKPRNKSNKSNTAFNEENINPQTNHNKRKSVSTDAEASKMPRNESSESNESNESSPNLLEMPTAAEIEQLAADNWVELVRLGWTIFSSNLNGLKGADVIVPPYLSAGQIKEIKSRTSSIVLLENVHYFRIKVQREGCEHPLKQYLRRYGAEFRPLSYFQLGDVLKSKYWQWISVKSHWNTGEANIWFRNGVSIPHLLDESRRGEDYFFEAEEIADYFLKQNIEDRVPLVETWK